jgi:hypothetical protein
LFISLTAVHIWANVHLVRVLVLDTLNPQRILLIIQNTLTEFTRCHHITALAWAHHDTLPTFILT